MPEAASLTRNKCSLKWSAAGVQVVTVVVVAVVAMSRVDTAFDLGNSQQPKTREECLLR